MLGDDTVGRRFYTRLDIQNILESNTLNAQVSYLEREDDSSPDNYILYYRLSPNNSMFADDVIHISKALIQVIHYHKKKLDSIEDLILKNFNVEPMQFNVRQLDTDYLASYYRMEVLTKGKW
jgi:hypothetical protein